MITLDSLKDLNKEELAYLYACCEREFDKNGYIYFDFDAIKHFKKQCIVDIVQKYADTLIENKDIPNNILKKLDNIY